MSEIQVNTERVISAPLEEVYAFLADYRESRPRILTDNFLDYSVEEGGTGAGTVFSYRFRAGGRERPYRMRVEEPVKGRALAEQDTESSFRTTWTVTPTGDGETARVRLESRWRGAGGIGGLFERLFAPSGLRRTYANMLGRLADALGEAR
jgi:uncharacterized protein YndB with AHSA1/START domain